MTGEPTVNIALTHDQAWLIYDLIATRVERTKAAEMEAMVSLGGAEYERVQAAVRLAIVRAAS